MDAFGFNFFKRTRNFIFVVGLGIGPLCCKLGNSLLIGWVYLGRHRGHVACYVFSHLQFNAHAAFVLYYACLFLTYQGKMWIKTSNNNLILDNWHVFFLLITKSLFSIMCFTNSKP